MKLLFIFLVLVVVSFVKIRTKQRWPICSNTLTMASCSLAGFSVRGMGHQLLTYHQSPCVRPRARMCGVCVGFGVRGDGDKNII